MSAAVQPAGSGGLSWGERIIMLAGGLPPALAMMALSSVLPKIDVALAHSPQDSFLVKQLVGAVGLAMVVGAPLAGFLANRISLRNILLPALIIYLIAGTTGLYLSDLHLLLTARLCVGVAAATIQIMAMTLINTRLSGPTRDRWMGLHIATAMLGTILVHPIAGLLGELGWRWPFAIYAAGLLLVPAVLCAKSLDGNLPHAPKNAAAPINEPSTRWSWFPWRYLLLAMAMGFIAYLPMVYASYLLRGIGVSSTTVIAMVLTADSLAGAGMALLYGRARRYLSYYGVFIASFACAGTGAFIAQSASDIVGIVLGLLVFGLGIGWFVPNLMASLATKVVAQRQSSAVGLVKAAHFLSAPVAITLAEPISRHYGPAGVLMAVAAVAALTLTCFLISSRDKILLSSASLQPTKPLFPK
jgi:predicted MFS family arabinose efflux permease